MIYLRAVFRPFLFTLLAFVVAATTQAGEKVILSVIDEGGTKAYSLKELDGFKQHVIETSTPWTERHAFSGPLLKDVLLKSGPYKGHTVKAYALNDYVVEINQDLLDNYPIILATRKDGNAMRIRDKGPIWLMLPLDQYPELDTRRMHGQMIWQLNKLESR
ncbi:hypothetical protein QKW35_06875 [Pontibacterium granulatum]|uniref:hypothetical protein n=1 Tax=Pontibacterium granulatum TaxID=2036029 RepID=UPI00249C91D2|nr:hypothetical protein [Pontibacterium granulatum]MDI3324096.1 hypothetical protein [Pontibacterium granulatum]